MKSAIYHKEERLVRKVIFTAKGAKKLQKTQSIDYQYQKLCVLCDNINYFSDSSRKNLQFVSYNLNINTLRNQNFHYSV